MLYLEHRPHPALAPLVQSLWYARDTHALDTRQRVQANAYTNAIHLWNNPSTSTSPALTGPSLCSG
jgi:hypothetical protein